MKISSEYSLRKIYEELTNLLCPLRHAKPKYITTLYHRYIKKHERNSNLTSFFLKQFGKQNQALILQVIEDYRNQKMHIENLVDSHFDLLKEVLKHHGYAINKIKLIRRQ